MIKEITRGTNLLVAKYKPLILIYPIIWLWAWSLVSSITASIDEQEKSFLEVKAILKRIREEKNE